MNNRITKPLFALAAVAAFALGGSALAGAAGNGATGSTVKAPPAAAAANQSTPPDMASHKAINPNEELLTGDTADKVEAAATAKVRGTVDRVETDDGGVYEAHVTKSDGTHVEVKVGKDFKVSSVNEIGAGGHGGPGAPGDQGGYNQ